MEDNKLSSHGPHARHSWKTEALIIGVGAGAVGSLAGMIWRFDVSASNVYSFLGALFGAAATVGSAVYASTVGEKKKNYVNNRHLRLQMIEACQVAKRCFTEMANSIDHLEGEIASFRTIIGSLEMYGSKITDLSFDEHKLLKRLVVMFDIILNKVEQAGASQNAEVFCAVLHHQHPTLKSYAEDLENSLKTRL